MMKMAGFIVVSAGVLPKEERRIVHDGGELDVANLATCMCFCFIVGRDPGKPWVDLSVSHQTAIV